MTPIFISRGRPFLRWKYTSTICLMISFIPYEQPIHATATIKASDYYIWNLLDVFMLQCIYAAVSQGILNSIIVIEDSAKQCRNHITTMFHKNKHSRIFSLKTNIAIPTWRIFHPPKLIVTISNSSLINLKKIDSLVSNTV